MKQNSDELEQRLLKWMKDGRITIVRVYKPDDGTALREAVLFVLRDEGREEEAMN